MKKEVTNGLENNYNYLFGWLFCLMGGSLVLNVLLKALGEMITAGIAVKVLLLFVMAMLIGLFVIIYRSERIYYINGVSFKEASEASSEARKAYALKHVNLMVRSGVVFTVYVLFSFMIALPITLDTVVFVISVLWGAFSSMKIKLPK